MKLTAQTRPFVNNRTHFFLIEIIGALLWIQMNMVPKGKPMFFLLTQNIFCFTHTPKKFPLRGYIPGTDFVLKKNWLPWNR